MAEAGSPVAAPQNRHPLGDNKCPKRRWRARRHHRVDTFLLLMAAATKAKANGYRVIRLHPALVAGHTLSIQGTKGELIQPVLWPQSPLDSACGACTVATALTVLSLIRPASLQAMSRRKSGIGAVFFEQMRDHWHTGINPDELVERVDAMGLPLKLTARFRNDPELDTFVIDNLMKGELVALSIASFHTRRTNHWTLAVGCGGLQRGGKMEVQHLYLVDASSSPPVFREWNAMLTLVPAKRRKQPETGPPTTERRKALNWSYSAPEWARPEIVRITSAIRFRRTD